MTVILPLLIMSGIMSGALLWMTYGLPSLLHLTYQVAEFCQSIFVRCVEYSSMIKLALLWPGVVVLAAGILYGIIRGIAGLVKANRAIRKLPLSQRRGSVVLIRDKASKAAFTHGLFRPVVYMSTGLLSGLDRDEIKAVFLHELHHKRHHDPLRFFIFTLLKDMFFYIPLIKYLVGYVRFKKEQEADDAAGASANEMLSLAGALLKVAAFQKEMAMMPAAITGGIEGGAVGARIRRLVEGGDAGFKLPTLRTIAVSLFATVFLSLSLAMPLNATYPGPKECNKRQCTMHAKKADDGICALKAAHRR